MSFHVVLIFVIFLLKDNQTTVIFGIRKQKKLLLSKMLFPFETRKTE